MKEPYHCVLRQLRRSAGLSQIEVSRILGVGGRSYLSMLESGDRIPTARDTILLSLLFGTEEKVLFPHLYESIHGLFKSNATKFLKEALEDEKNSSEEAISFIRNALSNAELQGNVEPLV
jgi:transcriptional regulator with XRE-family HTH domain